MKAWLITWDWIGDSAALADVLAGILNPRKSASRVAEIVEFLYYRCYANADELATFAKDRRRLPYKAETDFNSRIRCGHNPLLHAEQVFDLVVETDPESGLEIVSWHTYPVYAPFEEGPRKVHDGQRHRLKRRLAGPLSHEAMWDRAKGRFKDKFGNPESAEAAPNSRVDRSARSEF
jgi:hypothetical protein